MKVLFITNYFEPDSGAAAIRLSRLARQLHQRGHQVTVLTSLPHYPQRKIHEGYRHRLVVVENRDGLRVIQTWLFTIENHRIIFKLMSHLTLMITMFLRGLFLPKQDVILIEAQPVFPALGGVILALLKRTPYVLNVSDLWPDHLLSLKILKETDFSYRLSRHLVNFIYYRARRIVTLSPKWAERIEGYIGSQDKIKVIYNGVDLSVFTPQLNTDSFRHKYQLNHPKMISFIGTFSTQYDFQTMLAVTEMLGNRPDVAFLFIGQGTQSDEFKKLLENHPQVCWIHWLERDEIPQAWNASFLTYWAVGANELYEGIIPAKLYEAMACGVPIAAGIEGIGAKMIQESGAGLTVPCANAQKLAEAITLLLDDEILYKNCSSAARRYAEQHFDHEKVAQAYEHTLLEAL